MQPLQGRRPVSELDVLGMPAHRVAQALGLEYLDGTRPVNVTTPFETLQAEALTASDPVAEVRAGEEWG